MFFRSAIEVEYGAPRRQDPRFRGRRRGAHGVAAHAGRDVRRVRSDGLGPVVRLRPHQRGDARRHGDQLRRGHARVGPGVRLQRGHDPAPRGGGGHVRRLPRERERGARWHREPLLQHHVRPKGLGRVAIRLLAAGGDGAHAGDPGGHRRDGALRGRLRGRRGRRDRRRPRDGRRMRGRGVRSALRPPPRRARTKGGSTRVV